jgi:hypothetical protein
MGPLMEMENVGEGTGWNGKRMRNTVSNTWNSRCLGEICVESYMNL